MRDIWSLDIETRSTSGAAPYGALEPWRVRQGRAEISSIAVCRPDDMVLQIFNEGSNWVEQVRDVLKVIKGQVVYGQRTDFDIAWLIATIQSEKRGVPQLISDITWRDTKLLAKWLINGQLAEATHFSMSLWSLVKTFLPEHPMTPEFVEMKQKKVVPGEDEAYWRERGHLDALLTRALAVKLQDRLPLEQVVGYMTECECLAPVANAWANGIRVGVDDIEAVEVEVGKKMKEATDFLGIDGARLNSPKQLGRLLFEQWQLEPRSYGKSGDPSTGKDDLMWIQYDLKQRFGNDHPLVKKMDMVMQFKRNRTIDSKYLKTLRMALSNTQDGHIYGSPNLFGTYTGRMTYSNETVKGYKTSIALHQIPRKAKEVRGLLRPPEGMHVIESDASGQESRLMAIRSGDESMLQVFREGLNFHSMTGAAITGMDYYEFQKNYEEGGGSGFYTEQRQLGKLTNLSCNYRIGGKSLSEKAFVDYDTHMTPNEGTYLVKTFNRQYPGVPRYWSEVVALAKQLGYTECFGGRRYKIKEWGPNDSWRSESSAINFPIQGGGASMKEINVAETAKKLKSCWFALDLHDATFNFTDDPQPDELTKEVNRFLDDIDYKRYWGFEPPIPLAYESAYGKSFKDVK